MNKKMKIFIICVVFVLISSCKIDATGNDATGKDAEQNVKGKVQEFLGKILDPVKDKIASNGPIVDKLVKKLQEEEKVNNGEEENDKAVSLGEESKEDKEENEQAVNLEEKNAEEDKKVVNLEEKEVEVKKETEEDEDKEKIEEQKQKEKKAQQKRQRQEKKAQQKKQRQEERKRKKQEREKERKAKGRIKTLIDKIDKVNRDINDIGSQTGVEAKVVIDKITGPVYDDFTDGNKAIYKTWGDLEDEEGEELGKLLKELSDNRDELRTKLNKDNKKYYAHENEPPLKENVKIDEIKSDLHKLKSELEKVKEYLKDESNFETIKGYIDEERYPL
ncbi:ErpC protein [Borreliella lanei]|uniref:DNA repair exonuclease SbcCD ATPase subunit n=1 Tax=Borreliella lanei TaxID=373540 RepID=A0A7W9ZBP7_9SPIR|nr:ErpC protein [Borreliella lanei]MBB6208538.1 DNA repair exonuclease SbcCD ATPase subunit [Borreliella lanei]